jgi:flagellar assembly protein FliH
MSKRATRFTFDTVFTAGSDVVSDAARSRARRTLSQTELDQLTAEAHAEGSRSGEVRAIEAVGMAAHQLTTQLRQAIAAMDQIRADAAALALALAGRLARSALDAFPNGEVERALREAMHQAMGEPRIVLRTSPAVAEALGKRLADLAHEEGFDGRVQLSAEPHLHGADCRIEWRGGGAERSLAAIETSMNELIARRFADSSPVTEE